MTARWKVLLLAGLLVSPAACKQAAPPARPAAKARPLAPDFTLKDLQGRNVSLSQFRGKAVFLDFWATWCGPCQMSIPSVEKLHKDYAARGLQILSMNVDEDPSVVPGYVKSMGMSYPVLLVGGSGVDGMYGVSGIPAFLLIDKEGRVADGWEGFAPEFPALWRRSVDKLLPQ